MTYLWLVGVGLLMAAYQAIWWIVATYLLTGAALFLKWDREDRRSYPYAKPHWFEFIAALVIVSFVWPIAALTRNFCSGT